MMEKIDTDAKFDTLSEDECKIIDDAIIKAIKRKAPKKIRKHDGKNENTLSVHEPSARAAV